MVLASDEVYPRVCGGTEMKRNDISGEDGLSPRVRGNLTRVVVLKLRPGSIPACAGEPCDHVPFFVLSKVYPRVCGGTPCSFSTVTSRSGLSPRVRGNPFIWNISLMTLGSIPACAGEPPLVFSVLFLFGVYPRVCGGTGMLVPLSSYA